MCAEDKRALEELCTASNDADDTNVLVTTEVSIPEVAVFGLELELVFVALAADDG